jgi:hypothetical protein
MRIPAKTTAILILEFKKKEKNDRENYLDRPESGYLKGGWAQPPKTVA